ncbi:MAG: uracil-DNA glycosylase family protein [Alkalispirochaeta sp.]
MTELLQRIAAEARNGTLSVDTEAYTEARRDPTEPVLLGSGDLTASVGFFGRDPGRREVETGEPFVGKGGQLVRGALYRAAGGTGQPTLEESIAAGQRVFWGNTVPFKPVGNKAWPVAVKRRFLPFIRELLVEQWQGHDLITLGNQAFEWFGLAEPSLRPILREFWGREDRYEGSLEISLAGKRIRLHPLPHPSPLNATWHRQFPRLLDARLHELSWPE